MDTMTPRFNLTAPRLPGRLSWRFAWAGLALAASLAGCAPGRELPFLPAGPPNSFQLGVADQVRVITYGEEQLSGTFRVGDDGSIAVPLLGDVQAQGLTTRRLADRLTGELKKRNLLRDPSVSVEILSYRPVFVLGEVAKPGEYSYQPGMTLLTLVTVAGGFTYRAVEDYASVVRTEDGQEAVRGRLLPEAFLKPGDVVKIYDRVF